MRSRRKVAPVMMLPVTEPTNSPAPIANLKQSTLEERQALFESYAAIRTSTNTVKERLRCQMRFAYFLRYVKIPDVNKGLIQFELWDYLVEIADDWQTGDSWIEAKARQLGYSWLVASYAVWVCTFRDHARILAFSIEQRSSTELMDKVKAVNANLPNWLRRDFVRGRESDKRVQWQGNGAQFLALPSTAQAGRSYTATVVITDEWAFHQNAREHYAAYRSAIADGGQHIAISTGNGPGNMFHSYMTSTLPDIPYKKRFFGWRARPGRDDAWYAREFSAFMVEAMNPASEHFGKHPRLFYRENPETLEQVFEAFTGRVYDCFDPTVHVCAPWFDWKEARYRVAAVDPGGGDPTAINIVGQDGKGAAYQFAEWHKDDGAANEDEITLYLMQWHHAAPFHAVYVDGNEQTLIATLRKRGLPAFAADKERRIGIGHMYARIQMGTFYVSPDCTWTQREFQQYVWATTTSAGIGERWQTSTPVEHHGDHMDCARYICIGLATGLLAGVGTYKPGQQPDFRIASAVSDLERREEERRRMARMDHDPGPVKRTGRAGPNYQRTRAGTPGISRPDLTRLRRR